MKREKRKQKRYKHGKNNAEKLHNLKMNMLNQKIAKIQKDNANDESLAAGNNKNKGRQSNKNQIYDFSKLFSKEKQKANHRAEKEHCKRVWIFKAEIIIKSSVKILVPKIICSSKCGDNAYNQKNSKSRAKCSLQRISKIAGTKNKRANHKQKKQISSCR